MLVNLIQAIREMNAERAYSSTVYSGWGTSVNEMIEEAYEASISPRLVRRVVQLAEYGRWTH